LSTNHTLKIHPQWFRKVQNNELTFQVRRDDRSYQDGDTLTLCEWMPDEDNADGGYFTGLKLDRRISRVFRDLPGLQPGYVAFTTVGLVCG
jgi:hypothetical protein